MTLEDAYIRIEAVLGPESGADDDLIEAVAVVYNALVPALTAEKLATEGRTDE